MPRQLLVKGLSGVLCGRRRHCLCPGHLTGKPRHPEGRAIHDGSVRELWPVPSSHYLDEPTVDRS